jgi:hypothetical protein
MLVFCFFAQSMISDAKQGVWRDLKNPCSNFFAGCACPIVKLKRNDEPGLATVDQ